MVKTSEGKSPIHRLVPFLFMNWRLRKHEYIVVLLEYNLHLQGLFCLTIYTCPMLILTELGLAPVKRNFCCRNCALSCSIERSIELNKYNILYLI